MLKFDNVGIAYGKKEILSGVNAQIEKGKLTVLVGKNGSGKSSLLSALVGQVPFSGSVLLDSKPITSQGTCKAADADAADAARNGIHR